MWVGLAAVAAARVDVLVRLLEGLVRAGRRSPLLLLLLVWRVRAVVALGAMGDDDAEAAAVGEVHTDLAWFPVVWGRALLSDVVLFAGFEQCTLMTGEYVINIG